MKTIITPILVVGMCVSFSIRESSLILNSLAPASSLQVKKEGRGLDLLLQERDQPLHVNVPYKDSSLDFVLDAKVVGILREAGIDPQEFLEEAIAMSQEISPFLIGIRWSSFVRSEWGTFTLNVRTFYDKEVAQAVRKETLKKLLFKDVWKSVSLRKTLIEKTFPTDRKPYYLELEGDAKRFYQTQFTPVELAEIAMSFMTHQISPSIDLLELLVARYEPRRDPFPPEAFRRFKSFLEAHMEELDIDSQILACRILIHEFIEAEMYLEEHEEHRALESNQSRWAELVEKSQPLKELNRQLRDSFPPIVKVLKGETTTDEHIGFAERRLDLYHQMLKLNPNSRKLKKDITDTRKTLLKYRQEKGAREAAQSKARTLKSQTTEVLLKEVASAIASRNKYLGSALLQILSKRENLSLNQINMSMVLLPKAVTSYKEASEIFRNLVVWYRQSLINEVLIDFIDRLNEPQRESLAKTFRYYYEDSSSVRLEQVRSQPELSGVDEKVLEAIELRFRELKDQLDDQKIEFSQALEKAISLGVPVDRVSFIGERREPVYLNRTLEDLLSREREKSSDEKLQRAKEYFRVFYGVDLTIPLEEETPIYKVPTGARGEVQATLYSRNEIPALLKKLVLVDRWLSVLPRGAILTSLSFQQILIVKKMRAFYSHSDSVKMNKIALALENPKARHTLYHELGHSLHGPIEDFATFADLDRLRLVLLTHRDLFERMDPELLALFERQNIPLAEMGVLVSRIFQALFNRRLEGWKQFYQEKTEIEDMNDPTRFPEHGLIEEHYGIKTEHGDAPAIHMIYVFEIPLYDKTGDDNNYIRKTPEEMIAEYTQLYLFHPEALRKLDPVAFDLFNILLGEAHSPRRGVRSETGGKPDDLEEFEIHYKAESQVERAI